LEWSDHTIKDDFERSRFFIPVANASTGDTYVTTLAISDITSIDIFQLLLYNNTTIVQLHLECAVTPSQ